MAKSSIFKPRTLLQLTAFAVIDLFAGYAQASICLRASIDVATVNIPSHMNSSSVESLFDGSRTYSTNGNQRLHHPGTPGDSALIMRSSVGLLHAGTTFRVDYQNDDASGDSILSYIVALTANGYGASYFDRNGNGILDAGDFDVDNDGTINLGTGDYSPLGVVVQLYNGNPGNPVGSLPGVLVHTAYSPVRVIAATVYQFTVTAPGDFDHVVIESTPDANGADPRIIEIEHNGNPNSMQSLSVFGSSIDCGKLLL